MNNAFSLALASIKSRPLNTALCVDSQYNRRVREIVE